MSNLNPIRRGMFTASEFYKLMTVDKKPDELPTGAIAYIYSKVAETLSTHEKESYTTPSMQHGNDCEFEAVVAFEKQYNLEVCNAGDSQTTVVCCDIYDPLFGQVAGTPDGLIFEDGEIVSGLEIKCPDSHTHLFNIINLTDGESLKAHYPQYYWQVLGSMLLTETKYWYFMSYDNRFIDDKHKIHSILITKNEVDMEKLKNRLALAVSAKQSILNTLKEIK